MQYWLLKSEPGAYSFDDMLRDGETVWDGVRNHQAANNMKKMAVGDRAFFYHSVKETSVVGTVTISRLAAPDPTDDTGRWVAVHVKAGERLARPVTLKDIKAQPALADIGLVRQSRLSVVPLDKDAWDIILQMATAPDA